jgi:hypothetical protein
VTPGTPRADKSLRSRFRSLRLRSKQSSQQLAIRPDPDPLLPDIPAKWLEPGITGADLSLPLFDGTSTDPADYLIDLDTDSMERYPDVRIYFWTVTEMKRMSEDKEEPRPTDHEGRLVFDEKAVKEGREYLRESRIKGEGCVHSASFSNSTNYQGIISLRIVTCLRTINPASPGTEFLPLVLRLHYNMEKPVLWEMRCLLGQI